MLSTLLCASLMLARQGDELTGDQILSKLIAKYSAASSMSGEFLMTQTAQNKKVTILTKIATEKPSKLYIEQTSETVDPRTWKAVCDGGTFVYDSPWKPGSVFARQRIQESTAFVDKADGQPKVMKLNDLYIASRRSLGDPTSPFLELTLHSPESMTTLKAYSKRLYKPKKGADKTLEDGTVVYSITGQIQFGAKDVADRGLTVSEDYNAIGRIELLVSKEFDLRQVKISESLSIPVPDSNLPVQVSVVTTWAGKLNLDVKNDPKIFSPN